MIEGHGEGLIPLGTSSQASPPDACVLAALLILAALAYGILRAFRSTHGRWPWEQASPSRRSPINPGPLPKLTSIAPPPLPTAAPTLPYAGRRSLLSKGERAFFSVLFDVACDRFIVLAKVRLGDLVEVTDRSSYRKPWLWRVNQKHIDFVLCEPETIRPVLLIELDDRSHRRRDRGERDDFVNRCLQSAGLRLLRIPAQQAYDVQGLREQIRNATNTTNSIAHVERPSY